MLPRSLPRPPGAARALPGTYWGCQDDPKSREERCKSRQNRPKRRPGAFPTGPSERFRSGLAGHLAPNCPPKSSPRPPGGYFGSLGARFQTLRGPLGETSAAESAPFRGALAIASRPFHTTAPQVKKVTECHNHNPAKRPSKQSLTPKPLAKKGGRRCWWRYTSQKTMDTISC